MMVQPHVDISVQIIVGVLTVLLCSGLLIFILKLAFSKVEKLEGKMVDQTTCDERHRRIDEHLKDGKEKMKTLMDDTTTIKELLIKLTGKVENIEENSTRRREGDLPLS